MNVCKSSNTTLYWNLEDQFEKPGRIPPVHTQGAHEGPIGLALAICLFKYRYSADIVLHT